MPVGSPPIEYERVVNGAYIRRGGRPPGSRIYQVEAPEEFERNGRRPNRGEVDYDGRKIVCEFSQNDAGCLHAIQSTLGNVGPFDPRPPCPERDEIERLEREGFNGLAATLRKSLAPEPVAPPTRFPLGVVRLHPSA